jgi:large subunit ribosomal protein L17
MALLRGLVRALFEHEHINTTETRAKEVRSIAEKIITTAKKGIGEGNTNGVHARREARRVLNDEDLVKKLFTNVAPKLVDKPGGYTRIIKLGMRRGDAASMVKLEIAYEE